MDDPKKGTSSSGSKCFDSKQTSHGRGGHSRNRRRASPSGPESSGDTSGQHSRNARPNKQRQQRGDAGEQSRSEDQHQQQELPVAARRDHRRGGGGEGSRGGNGGEGSRGGRGYGRGPGRHGPRHFVLERRNHAGLPFKERSNLLECIICRQKSDLFGVGECLHPACLECSLRVRIISGSRACPVCRAESETLYITEAPAKAAEFSLPDAEGLVPHRDGEIHGIKFTSTYSVAAFESYLENKCNVCGYRGESVVFPTFAALRQHVQQAHQLTFCRLCVDNANTLPKDRRVYNREQLDHHLNGQASGEEGFKGHPKCFFCEERYYDDEEQYRHLRREHYFCALCEADGLSNFFYKNSRQLLQHYKRSHHPCVDPDCITAGIVFRSEFELSLHRSREHGAGGSQSIPLASQLDFRFSTRVAQWEGYDQRREGSDGGDDGPTAYRIVPSAQSQSTSRIVPSLAVASTPGQPPIDEGAMTIVPSANATTIPLSRYGRQGENYGAQFPGLPQAPTREQLAQVQFPPLPYGAPPSGLGRTPAAGAGWRPPQQSRFSSSISATPTPVLARSVNLLTNSSEQFPSLSGGGVGTSSYSTAARTQAGMSSSAWSRGNTSDLFKYDGKKKEEKPKRAPIHPTPDIWPEHVRETLRARAMGLPEPEPEELGPGSLLPTMAKMEEEAREAIREKKLKKKKSKTVASSSAKTPRDEQIVPTQTKFGLLAEEDSGGSGSDKASSTSKLKKQQKEKKEENWWTAEGAEHGERTGSSAAQEGNVRLQPTGDGFVKIHLGGTEEEKEDKPLQVSGASYTSLASIAQRLEQVQEVGSGGTKGSNFLGEKSLASHHGVEDDGPPPGFAHSMRPLPGAGRESDIHPSSSSTVIIAEGREEEETEREAEKPNSWLASVFSLGRS